MRVMFLADALGNGGAERQLELLATHLPESCEGLIFALDGGAFAARLEGKGVPVTILPRRFRRDVRPAFKLWRALVDVNPDVVHSWGWMSTVAIAPLCQLRRVPLVDGTLRSGTLERDHPRLRRLGMALATTVVANSHAGLLASGVAPEKGDVVYNGFDWSRIRTDSPPPETDASHAFRAGEPFTVVMTARMVPAKDYGTVIRAARLLAREGGAWRFILIGDGQDRDRIQTQAVDLVDRGMLEFPEPSVEVIQFVRSAQTGVLMTNPAYAHEGLSNSIMEYMACGLPVVCGEGGGNREIVVDGVTGLVIQPSSADELARALIWLRSHESERLAMGDAGRQRIEHVFSVEQMIQGYLRVYADAVCAVGSRQ